jgi:RHS repeat-associated protein
MSSRLRAVPPYYVHPDHLGSLTLITDATGGTVQKCSFDAWGKRTFIMKDPSLVFDRGFTGHEHLDEFGLINMNGRMYDPIVGRFLSPDPYVQAPDFSQSFNRYSYCLNNPLNYTDPDGEVWWFVPVITAIVFGMGNTAIHVYRGDVNNFGDGLKYFSQGVVNRLCIRRFVGIYGACIFFTTRSFFAKTANTIHKF